MSPVLVLVGPPGAGKTTIGSLVATRLGLSLRDTDADVESRAGVSVSEIFVEEGEAHFRELEAAAVLDALAADDVVVALGGGAVLAEGSRSALRACGAPVVLLEVGISDAARRVGFNRDRPLLLGNPRQQWSRLLDARRALYDEVATARVSTDGRTPDDIAAEVLALVRP